ncbi:MAG: glycerol-3-phosphate acyltransferase [Acidimicrobiia bacterium]|nr:glycerol-3-phosphate acyltransferase [Acidimicrobiia bacterium]
MSMQAEALLALAAGFLVGSVPPAIPIGRAWGVDVCREGTGNPGVSNVNELAGGFAAFLTFAADLVIGAGVVLVPTWLGFSPWVGAAAGVGTMAGRAWAPWLGGSGGRGQMLALAMSLGLVPWAGAVYVTVYAIGAASKQMGLAGLVNLVILVPSTAILYGDDWAVAFGVSICLIGIVRRLQGSPDGREYSLVQRLLHDRERPPEGTQAAAAGS